MQALEFYLFLSYNKRQYICNCFYGSKNVVADNSTPQKQILTRKQKIKASVSLSSSQLPQKNRQRSSICFLIFKYVNPDIFVPLHYRPTEEIIHSCRDMLIPTNVFEYAVCAMCTFDTLLDYLSGPHPKFHLKLGVSHAGTTFKKNLPKNSVNLP